MVRVEQQTLFLWNLESRRKKKTTLKLLHKKTSNDYTNNYNLRLSVLKGK